VDSPRNKFVMGANDAGGYQPDKRLENMRPQYIYDALLIRKSTETMPFWRTL